MCYVLYVTCRFLEKLRCVYSNEYAIITSDLRDCKNYTKQNGGGR